jgi:hypothetical protein
MLLFKLASMLPPLRVSLDYARAMNPQLGLIGNKLASMLPAMDPMLWIIGYKLASMLPAMDPMLWIQCYGLLATN